MRIKTKVYLHLALFSILLYLINLAFNNFIYEIYFIIPLWKIYAFNIALVLVTFWTLKILTKTKLSLLFSFVFAVVNNVSMPISYAFCKIFVLYITYMYTWSNIHVCLKCPLAFSFIGATWLCMCIIRKILSFFPGLADYWSSANFSCYFE